MKTDFIDELKWRGLLHDVMPGTEELLNKEAVSGYIGFDPTADSLHVGSLLQIITLMRFQKSGHRPITLIGGATGMVGDPSGKSAERNLLDEKALEKNVEGLKKQLNHFLHFDEGKAELVNNYDWMKEYSFINFIRDVGKHLTVNYMMAKDSVKNRLETGMSFTEFSYQLLQAYDFLWLYENKNCRVQLGGSDQWGNITSGTELIRRKINGESFAITTQLIKKADGTKFGKTESGNIWLDAAKTSPYRFYQFWLNSSDDDAKNYIRYFTFLTKQEIESIEAEHNNAPHLRLLQKALAKELTCLTHSIEAYEHAVHTSDVLFKGDLNDLAKLDEQTFLDIFDGVPINSISKSEFEAGIPILELLTDKTQIFSSKGEARKMLQSGGISLNKEKITDIQLVIHLSQSINNKYLILQKGKKNFYLCNVID
ncbi:MAG: tyrosine--tRNA ligase [Bacteroidia bacterium]